MGAYLHLSELNIPFKPLVATQVVSSSTAPYLCCFLCFCCRPKLFKACCFKYLNFFNLISVFLCLLLYFWFLCLCVRLPIVFRLRLGEKETEKISKEIKLQQNALADLQQVCYCSRCCCCRRCNLCCCCHAGQQHSSHLQEKLLNNFPALILGTSSSRKKKFWFCCCLPLLIGAKRAAAVHPASG